MTKRKFTHPKDALEGHEWETVDGREVTKLTCFAGTRKYSIAGVMGGELQTWSSSGQFFYGSECGSCLVDAPKKGEVWVNVYHGGWSNSFMTLVQADSAAQDELLARIRVPYVEGQLDE